MPRAYPLAQGSPQSSPHICPPDTNRRCNQFLTGTIDVLGQKILYCWGLSHALFSMFSCVPGLYLDARSTPQSDNQKCLQPNVPW